MANLKVQPIILDNIREAQENDEYLAKALKCDEETKQREFTITLYGILRFKQRIYVPKTIELRMQLLKEANVISRELGKDVSYNFTIASGGSLAAPTSSINTIAGLDEFGDVSDPVLTSELFRLYDPKRVWV